MTDSTLPSLAAEDPPPPPPKHPPRTDPPRDNRPPNKPPRKALATSGGPLPDRFFAEVDRIYADFETPARSCPQGVAVAPVAGRKAGGPVSFTLPQPSCPPRFDEPGQPQGGDGPNKPNPMPPGTPPPGGPPGPPPPVRGDAGQLKPPAPQAGEEPTPGSAVAVASAPRVSTGAVVAPGAGVVVDRQFRGRSLGSVVAPASAPDSEGRAGADVASGPGAVPSLPPDQRLGYDLGARYSEMNTILRRIRRRYSGEPTASERARLAELREEIASLKRSGSEHSPNP